MPAALPAAGRRRRRHSIQQHVPHILLLLSLLLSLAGAFLCPGTITITTTAAAAAAAARRRVHARPALQSSVLPSPLRSQTVGRLAAGSDGEGESGGQGPPSSNEEGGGGGGGFLGSGLSTREALISTLGITPLTLLLAVAALGMAGANALYGPGWLRPSLGLKPTTFQSRNLVLPLDQEGMLFPVKGQGLEDVARAWERD